jgi:hypothetical protein
MAEERKGKRGLDPEHCLCAEIAKCSSSYFIINHQSQRSVDAEISRIEPIQHQHIGERIECSLVYSVFQPRDRR